MAIQAGQILDGKYRIIREIGSGSMGAVFEGENILIRRQVAIKVLLPQVAVNPNTVQRFEREAQAAGRIGSEHIVEVLDLGGLPDGSYYLVMEYLEGTSLADRIRSRGRLTPREATPIVQQLLTGLEAAHEARIIHRDLKPDNVFLVTKPGQGEFVKVLDFGVSKFNPLTADDGVGMDLTKAGTVVGTPFYMSPEQAKGSSEVDARSDIYSVGVILYEAVTGQRPFHAGTFNELIFKIVLEAPPPPEYFVPDLDAAFGRIIRKAMARVPQDRYQSADEMRAALSVWLHTGADDLASTVALQRLPPPPPPGMPTPPPQVESTAVTRLVGRSAGSDEGSDQSGRTVVVQSDPSFVASQPSFPTPPPQPSGSMPQAATSFAEPPTMVKKERRNPRLVVLLVGAAAALLALGGTAAVVWTTWGSTAIAESADTEEASADVTQEGGETTANPPEQTAEARATATAEEEDDDMVVEQAPPATAPRPPTPAVVTQRPPTPTPSKPAPQNTSTPTAKDSDTPADKGRSLSTTL